jgi:hypothetical protein
MRELGERFDAEAKIASVIQRAIELYNQEISILKEYIRLSNEIVEEDVCHFLTDAKHLKLFCMSEISLDITAIVGF